MRALAALLLAWAVFTPLPAVAVNPDEVLADPVLELRAREISKNLRCLVCQNQSIDDSDADLAKDLRLIVRERLIAGDSDDDVIEHVVARYGDFVLLKPPFKGATVMLWAGPALFGVAGLLAIVFFFRRHRQGGIAASVVAPLSDKERARLNQLLGDDSDEISGGDRGGDSGPDRGGDRS